LKYSLVRICKSSAAVEAIPGKKTKLELSELEDRLAAAGYMIITNVGPIMVVRKGEKGVEITIYDTGRLLLKTKDKERAMMEIREMERFL